MTTACDGDVEVTAEYPSHGKKSGIDAAGGKIYFLSRSRHSALHDDRTDQGH